MMREHYEIDIAWSADDAAFVARFPEFPSLGAHGETRLAALNKAEELLREMMLLAERGEIELPKSAAA